MKIITISIVLQPAPSPAPILVAAPAPVTAGQCPGTCPFTPYTLAGDPSVTCPCPETKTCFVEISSTGWRHTVKCGSIEKTLACGGPLYVSFFLSRSNYYLTGLYFSGYKEGHLY